MWLIFMATAKSKYTKESLANYLTFSDAIPYSPNIILHPIKMGEFLRFNSNIESFTIRKNAIFPVKEIIKMKYLDFLLYCLHHPELEEQYNINGLTFSYLKAYNVLQMACPDAEIEIGENKACFKINGEIVDNGKFDDLRRIIIIQNDVDFDLDEFVNIDTLRALEKAEEFERSQRKEKYTLEDYVDSLCVAEHLTEQQVKELTIHKFWRRIKKLSSHEEYICARTGEMSGMVKFENGLTNWMASNEVADKYANVKTDEQKLKQKING